MPTPEILERLRKRKEERERRSAELAAAPKSVTPFGMEAFVQSGRQLLSHQIQRAAEEQEAGPRFSPERVKHWGREAGADLARIAELIPGVDGISERIDPSQETELGADVEYRKALRETELGRPLSWKEELDVQNLVQDEAMPWLTERYGPGEGVSARGLLEIPADIAIGAATTLIPGGAAANVGKVGRAAALASQMAGQSRTGVTGAVLRGADPAIRAATRAAEEAILVPKRVEDLMGAAVSKPLGFAWRGVRALPGVPSWTSSTIRAHLNQFRDRAVREGIPATDAEAASMKQMQDAVNAGAVSDIPKGTNITRKHLRGKRNDTPEVVSENGTADGNMFNVEAIPSEPNPNRTSNRRVRAQYLLKKIDPRKGKAVPEWEMYRIMNGFRNTISKWWDGAENKISGTADRNARRAYLLIEELEKAGVVRPLGRMSAENAKNLDNVGNRSIGESFQSANNISDKTNFVFSDEYFRKNNIRASFMHDVLADDPIRGRNLNNVRNDVAPGFGDVIERKDLYARDLKKITITMKRGTTTAYDMVNELARLGKELEVNWGTLGKKVDRTFGVVDEMGVPIKGRAHFPRGILVEEDGIRVDRGIREDSYQAVKDPSILRREHSSQGEGILDGSVYVHPAEALRDHTLHVGKAVRERRYADFMKQFASENNLQYGKMNELLVASTEYQDFLKAMSYLHATVSRRLSRLPQEKMTVKVKEVSVGPQSLPAALARSAPRYRQYQLNFESDLDRALYIVGNPTTRSKSDPQFMEWLRKQLPELTPGAIREQGRVVRDHIRGIVTGQPVGRTLIPTSPTAQAIGPKATGKVQYVSKQRPSIASAKQFIDEANMEETSRIMAGDSSAATHINALRGKVDGWIAGLAKFGDELIPPSQKEVYDKQLRGMVLAAKKAHTALEGDLKKVGPSAPGGSAEGSYLGGLYFPTHMYDEATETLAKLTYGKRGDLGNATFITQGLLKQVGATMDFSGAMIQGVTAVWRDAFRLTAGRATIRARALLPGETGKRAQAELAITEGNNAFHSIWAMLMSGVRHPTKRGGNNVVNETYDIFDARAKITGAGDTNYWIKAGGAFRDNATDYTLGSRSRGIAGSLGRLPGLRNAELMFNFVGNKMRLDMMDRELQIVMKMTGKSADELLKDGTASSIASVMNAMMGVGRRNWGGDLSQFAFFAPSFLHARLRVVGMLLNGDAIERRIARGYVATFIGSATTVTIGINTALGEETDIQPWIRSGTGKWRYNPNFMRLKIGELNISLFGPWDSLLRMMGTPATILANQAHGGPLGSWERVNEFVRDARGVISSPLTGITLEQITGEDSIGRKARIDWTGSGEGIELDEWLTDHLLPFAWQDLVEAGPGEKSVRERLFYGSGKERIEAVAQTGLQLFGAKSSYETTYETQRKMIMNVLELGPDHPLNQEAFGLMIQGKRGGTQYRTPEEYDEVFNHIRGVFEKDGNNLTFSLDFMRGDRTPPLEEIEQDVINNIESLLQKGAFPQVMTAAEANDLIVRQQERIRASARPYDRYRVERDDILADETKQMGDYIEAFKRGDKKFGNFTLKNNIQALIGQIETIRSESAKKRAELTEPGGKYEGVHDLFEHARKTALGNTSTSNADIYDKGQALYYEMLYPANPTEDYPSIADDQGIVDWDLREERRQEWLAEIGTVFPDLNQQYIVWLQSRIESSENEHMPMEAQAILAGNRILSESNYYGQYDAVKKTLDEMMPGQGAPQQIEDFLDMSNDTQERYLERNPDKAWLGQAKTAARDYRMRMRKNDPRLDGIVQLLGGKEKPATIRGVQVEDILSDHELGIKPIDDLVEFLWAVQKGDPLDKFLQGVTRSY